jgi:hypothetical protein
MFIAKILKLNIHPMFKNCEQVITNMKKLRKSLKQMMNTFCCPLQTPT